jgi:hypothetical protein
MYEEIIELLRCPVCKSGMDLKNAQFESDEVISGEVHCKCDKSWKVVEGVLDFESEEQSDANRWTEIFKNQTLEEFNQMISEKEPKNQRELGNKAIKYLIEQINRLNSDYVVDIATGRGTMLKKLAEGVNKEIHLICTDLSAFILKMDRKEMIKVNPKLKISYIACDASNLPFADNRIDLALSFFGVANMAGLIKKTLIDVNRILIPGNDFLNVSFFVKPDSKSVKLVKEYMKNMENDDLERFLHVKGATDIFNSAGFEKTTFYHIGESVAEKNELDLVPAEGDWFELIIAIAQS